MLCPCHSGKLYELCCKPFHEGVLPDTPLELMRSRYAAYALKLADYLIKTTHPDNPYYQADHLLWAQEILVFSQNTDFIGLDILDVGKDTVTFKAHLKQGTQDASFTEKSTFKKLDGRWLYKKGKTTQIT